MQARKVPYTSIAGIARSHSKLEGYIRGAKNQAVVDQRKATTVTLTIEDAEELYMRLSVVLNSPVVESRA